MSPTLNETYMLKHSDFDQTDTAVRAKILSEALPYIQKFSNRTIVVKYGGAAMKDSSLKDKVMQDIVLLSFVGIRVVVVHGGGPEINSWLIKLGIEPQFKNGLRVTSQINTQFGVIPKSSNPGIRTKDNQIQTIKEIMVIIKFKT